MNFLLAFIAFDLIVIAHELGHFIVAKLADIKVLEFSLFAGPKLFSFQKGETTYSLRLIPILAYVKLEGEEDDSTSERSLTKKPKLIRAAVMAGGPVANLLVAVIALTIVFASTGFTTTQVNEVAQGYSAQKAGIHQGDKIISFDNKKVYHPMDIFQFMYVSKGKPAEVDILRDGQRIKTTISLMPLIPAALLLLLICYH
jgi:regulator of sigma E protease